MQSVEVEIRNAHGLHARPGALFYKAARKFRSTIRLENLTRGGPPIVVGASLTDLIGGGFGQGHVVRITAEGEDEREAVEGLRSLIESGLGERVDAGPNAASPASPAASSAGPAPAPPPAPVVRRPAPASPSAPLRTERIQGTPGAPGIAVGPVWTYVPPPPPRGDAAGGEDDAGAAVRRAADEAARQLEDLAARVRDAGRADEAGIFEAQALIAVDAKLVDEAVRRAESGERAVASVEAAADALATSLAASDDETFAARAADVRDVGARMVRILTGERLSPPAAPSIAVAEDLPPSVAAEIPPGLLLGIALEGGSRTAHAVILARGLGIPAVVGAAGLLDAASRAAQLALDGAAGEVILDPSETDVAALRTRDDEAARRAAAGAALRGRPGATSDGRRIVLAANIGGPAEAARALDAGAEGVGLFRTEFLYMRRAAPPAEAEQIAAYRDVLRAFGPDRPVVIRLADIGGDKGIPYLHLPAEANPFLGVRAIRLGYAASGAGRELLLTQLRAIWRAGGEARIEPHVMAPMVATIADVELFLELRDRARDEVRARGERSAERMHCGIMVEVPSAALLAPELARMVEFFSIGTNDLTQYVMAADRGNAALGRLHDALHPAVLRSIAGVVAAARAAHIPVAVCGELASDPAGALVLAGLGVEELSMDAAALDAVRAALAATTAADLERLAEQALSGRDAAAVRALAVPLLERQGREG